MIFFKDVIYSGVISTAFSPQIRPHSPKIFSCLYGVMMALAALVSPGSSLADSTALSCQVTGAKGIPETPIQPALHRALPVTDVQRERCRKSIPTLKRLIRSGHAHIVDLRGTRQYEKSHLQDSINIPEYLVRTKNFLKNRPLVLVGEGFDDPQHFQTCLGLLNSGFKDVTVLEGGVARWQGLLGAAQSESMGWQLPVIDPREAFTALRSGQWTVVTLLRPEREQAARSLFSEQDVIDIDSLQEQDRSTLSSANYLIVSEDETSNQLISARLKKQGIVTAYWLDGGATAYSRFMQSRTALLARIRRGPVKQAGCGVL